jgi:CheY-like chemotaxis protein
VPELREAQSAGTQTPANALLSQEKALRILVAEDNVVNQRVTALQLQKLGHKTDIAANGLEVMEALERAKYDVILMDCQMPEMDGYETTRRIRADERYDKIKIVAMTANAMIGDREACIDAGMNGYVSKPTRLEDLEIALKEVQTLDIITPRSSLREERD